MQCPSADTPLPPIGGAERGEPEKLLQLRLRYPGSQQKASALTLCGQKKTTQGKDVNMFMVGWGSPRAKASAKSSRSEESPEEMRNPESAQQGEFAQAQKLLVRCAELFKE